MGTAPLRKHRSLSISLIRRLRRRTTFQSYNARQLRWHIRTISSCRALPPAALARRRKEQARLQARRRMVTMHRMRKKALMENQMIPFWMLRIATTSCPKTTTRRAITVRAMVVTGLCRTFSTAITVGINVYSCFSNFNSSVL